jgi:hypothetical protein
VKCAKMILIGIGGGAACGLFMAALFFAMEGVEALVKLAGLGRPWRELAGATTFMAILGATLGTVACIVNRNR